MKIKAAVLYEPKAPLKIQELSVPELKRGQVLVKLQYSGVCHSQIMEANGLRGPDKYLPHLLGHEGSGQVVSVGPDVSKVQVGDAVVLGWIKAEGIEAGGTVYDREGIKINAGGVTTFCDHAVVSENRVVKLPEGIGMDLAVLFGCAIPTGAGIVLNELEIKKGSSLAVFGLGGIGMSALIASKLFDLRTLIAVDIEASKLQLAKEFGATHVLNPSQCDVKKEIFDITENVGVDNAVEAAGTVESIERAYSVIRKNGGQLVFASHPKAGDTIRIDPFDLICGKQIRGSWGGASKPDRDIPRIAELFRQKSLPFHRLLSEPYEFQEINQAMKDLEERKVTRALIRFQ